MPIEIDEKSRFSLEFGVCVTDIEQSLRFYRDTLGFEVFGTFSRPDMRATGLRLGQSSIILVDYEEELPQHPHGRAIGYRYLVVHVSDASAAAALAETNGYTIDVPHTRWEGTPEFAACEFAMVQDPDGNRVELLQGSPWVG